MSLALACVLLMKGTVDGSAFKYYECKRDQQVCHLLIKGSQRQWDCG